jgi:hypothetical protein
MRDPVFRVQCLVELLQKLTIVTMVEMKAVLGTSVDMTVFRKLREIKYCTSYSHRGKYYALEAVARFDERGLWSCQEARFSRMGSLVDTAEHFVVTSRRGFLASELSSELQVETKEALLKLVRLGRLARECISGVMVYCSPDLERRRQQLLARRLPAPHHPLASLWDASGDNADEARAAVILFLSTLNQKQRRLYAGLESLRQGTGGDRRIAELIGMDVHTVARGRRELLCGDVDTVRVRRPGGGRKAVEKKAHTSSR